ncbi:MAG: hypothetical protein M1827_007093 [Pycnora praestabilis]|nr:MAG: hypothetical protein M1827_007093 [Pycnora praestabilis]
MTGLKRPFLYEWDDDSVDDTSLTTKRRASAGIEENWELENYMSFSNVKDNPKSDSNSDRDLCFEKLQHEGIVSPPSLTSSTATSRQITSPSPLTPATGEALIPAEFGCVPGALGVVCFGSLLKASVTPLRSSKWVRRLHSRIGIDAPLRLRFRSDATTLLSQASEEVGALDIATSNTLRSVLAGAPSLSFEAFIDRDSSGSEPWGKHMNPALEIIIYGPDTALSEVGDAFSTAYAFLQEPSHIRLGTTYRNPHVLSWSDETSIYRRVPSESSLDIPNEIEAILSHADDVEPHPEVKHDIRLRTVLKNHQLVALEFMAKREENRKHGQDKSLWELTYVRRKSLHITVEALDVHVYHGSGTVIDDQNLVDKDIVLTTFETVTSDYRTYGPLRKTSWFRIVIDEAHYIRNYSTKTFEAVTCLEAQNRWCLTGTPVQNRLDDLFSLTKFLRFYPLDDLKNARKYILEPLSKKDRNGLINLRLAMRAIALRRNKQSFDDRRRTEKVVFVDLSYNERERYTALRDRARRYLSDYGAPEKSNTLLRSIGLLRKVCNHGTTEIISRPDPVGSSALRSQTLSCDNCFETLTPPPQTRPSEESIASCGHILCGECTQEQASSEDPRLNSIPMACSICNVPAISRSRVYNDVPESTNFEHDTDMDREETPPHSSASSSKIEKVLHTLLELRTQCDGQPPIKSLVFSCWRTTLDCMECALSGSSIPFLRFDGRDSLDRREAVIGKFQSTPEIEVMLLTFGSGSVGLNLAAATHVHLVEPQWNPMVENQAAARVDRLDQEKAIVIYRYIVRKSIEEASNTMSIWS